MDPVSKAQTDSQNTVLSKSQYRGLRPFKPGQSGNPGGRPKRKFATKVYAELFRDKEFREQFKQSVRKIVTAGKGMAPVLMTREMSERLEGPVTQSLEISGEVTLIEAVRRVRQRKDELIELRNAS